LVKVAVDRRGATASRARALLLVAAVLAVSGFVWWRHGGPHHDRLPDSIVVEDVVADFSHELDRSRVAQEVAGDPVRAGEIRPGNRLDREGERPTLITPPPARLRFPVEVPRGGVLRFGVGVQGDGRRDPERSAVRFTVEVDGRQVWTSSVNPALTRHDRRWFDERIDLGPYAGKTVELSLVTTAEQPGRTLAGVPGWGTVRLVRETARSRQPARRDAPNVLVLLVDTMRADHLGCYGATPSPSPNLDALAAGGLVFTQAIAQASWTLPSVASIFTGLLPRSHGATGKDIDTDVDAAWGFLADGVVTWAEAASRAGITTVGVSANPLVSRGTNLVQGFETFVELPWNPREKRWGTAAEVNTAFLDWLAPNRGHRFLAYLHYMEPHDPYTPSPEFWPSPPPGIRADLAAGWVLDVSKEMNAGRGALLPPEHLAYLRALYDGEIRTWDAELPSLLAGLERLGLRDSTVVIVTADHGEEFQEHGLLLHRSHLYDELLRVPLVVAGPGIPAGRRDEQVQGIDVFPTMAELLGFERSPALAGHSVLGAIPSAPVVSETNGLAADRSQADLVAVRTPKWKLIEIPARATSELYDLIHDPGEQSTLASRTGQGPVLAAALAEVVQRAPPPPVRNGRDPALGEKLRALGYID
jgi:arylsulfatase A-like enzyme